MTTSRSRLLLLAVGLLTAGPASAATLSVYAKMSGSTGTGAAATAIGLVAPVSGTTTINCFTNSPANCVDTAATGAIVLEATSQLNATFVSWSGCASVAGAQCTLDLTTNKTVTANFRAATQALTVKTYPIKTATYTPPFGGKLTAATTPAINCGRDTATVDVTACAAPASGDVVITAVPLAGGKVTSWSGCTPLTATTCSVTMSSTKVVSATFGPANIPVTVQKSGVGTVTAAAVTGVVTDAINCGTDCSGQVVSGGSITFVAAPPAGAMFAGWTGCSSADRACTLTNVTAPVTVTASFRSTTCAACHGLPPTTHAAFSGGCADCHAGYSNTTTSPTDHMNGQTVANNNKVYPPASFGFNLELVAFQPFADATYPRGYVDIRATDNAATALDLINLLNTCQMNSGSLATLPCDGSSRAPRVSIGQIQADGSYRPALRGSVATTPASSETIAVARLTDMGGGVFRYQPQYGFLAAVAYDATRDYRAVVYGGRYFKPAGQSAVPFYSTDYADLQGSGTVRADATVNDSKCNACHGQLTLHGMRRGVNVCLTCHNINLPLGSGNTDAFKWDLKNLAHKLHSGLNYDGINPMTGVQGTAWGTTMDASHMAMGPSHQTYFEGAGATTTPAATADDNVHQLPTQIQCFVCHDETQSNHLVASQAGCSSCHPINWVTGAGHGASYPTVLAGETGHPHTDAECAGCHPSTGPVVADFAAVPPVISFPIATVHSALWEPKTGVDFGRAFQFQGTGEAAPTTVAAVPTVDGVQRHKLEVNVTGFSVDATSGRATILFTVLLDNAPYTELVAARAGSYAGSTESNKSAFPTCAFTLAGPAATDYVVPANGSNNLSCGAFDATNGSAVVAVNAAAGEYSVTPTTNLNVAGFPVGTYTLSYEMMYSRQGGTPTTGLVRKPFAAKPSFYTVTKATGNAWSFASGSPRRAVVSFDKCNACHVQIGFHSNQGRQGPDYCAVCHNPMLDNGTRDRVKFADARDPLDYGAYITGTVPVGQKTYLVESVSTNIFIHRIHMGSDLPSVQDAAQASPWVPEPGRIFYGATRSNNVGATSGASNPATDTTPPSITDLSNFAMPNPMGRCNQCHLDDTWAAPETSADRAPIRRTFKVCAPVTPAFEATAWEGTGDVLNEQWCAIPGTSGPTTVGTLWTPPIKAVCTSCHDDIATDAHADANTVNPMTQGAVEGCATCHGAGAPWNALTVHPNIP